jgi:large conductance mechanosensitive channel
MGLLAEFRDFAVKGNAVDMAVGIIVGGAFGKVVSSLVSDVVMPPIGMLLGRVDFSNLSLTLQQKSKTTAEVMISYGKFLNNILDFLIVALCVFLVIKQINRLRQPPPAEPTTKTCPQCLSTIPLKAVRCAHCTAPLEN